MSKIVNWLFSFHSPNRPIRPTVYRSGFSLLALARILRLNLRMAGCNQMSLMEKDIVLTTEEAIKYLKVSKPTFFKCIRSGKIRAIKVGKGWRILLSELNRFLLGEENHFTESVEKPEFSKAGDVWLPFKVEREKSGGAE